VLDRRGGTVGRPVVGGRSTGGAAQARARLRHVLSAPYAGSGDERADGAALVGLVGLIALQRAVLRFLGVLGTRERAAVDARHAATRHGCPPRSGGQTARRAPRQQNPRTPPPGGPPRSGGQTARRAADCEGEAASSSRGSTGVTAS